METIAGDCEVDWMDISRTTSLIIASSYEDYQLRLWDYCNPNFNATKKTDVKDPRLRFSIDGSEFIVSPAGWDGSEENFMEKWEISQSPLGLRCLGREPYDPDQRLTEELPHRISEDKRWVVDRDGSRVCWIPPEWRSPISRDVFKSKFVACPDSERMLIVDLPHQQGSWVNLTHTPTYHLLTSYAFDDGPRPIKTKMLVDLQLSIVTFRFPLWYLVILQNVVLLYVDLIVLLKTPGFCPLYSPRSMSSRFM